MSAQNVMASISRTLGNREHKPAGNEIRFAGDERKDKLYEPKHKQKLVRVLTVVAYVIFVSMAAILLSLYYTFLWDPKDVSIRMRKQPECVEIKSSNSFTTPSIRNETQIERMTTKSMTIANEQSPVSEIITTPQQKDLLTILTEIVETSSNATPLTTSEDLQTSLSTETKEISTKMHSKIN
ncbi:hypothetical protein WN48_11298 [Eufriesea mexicana]|uniref:InaF motif containing 2 n=1 Tax=Eufriesea mexicana TaxID=516756 RepID=A0A310SD90_9HYME|nr:hypothetical protein WN48_11298 [Eufriesea mexicana]